MASFSCHLGLLTICVLLVLASLVQARPSHLPVHTQPQREDENNNDAPKRLSQLKLLARRIKSRAVLLQKSASDSDSEQLVDVDDPADGVISCAVCKELVSLLQEAIQTNASEEEIVKAAITYCISKQKADDRVCHGIIHEFKDEFIGVVVAIPLDPNETCGYIVGNSCAIPHYPFDESWTVTILNTTKPSYTPPAVPAAGKPTAVFAHLSDLHYDAKYAAGSLAGCSEPLCCRAWFGPGKAGVYGSYGCDSPLLLLESTLQELANVTPPLKYVIFTGDIPAHNVWNQSRADIIKSIVDVSNLFSKYLPKTKVYPALGNHESAPVNSFPPPFVTGYNSHKWLLDTLATHWGKDLPADTLKTIRLGGFYSTEAETGLQIISLNINYCNPMNWWLFINTTDPAGQLAWFRDELQALENRGAKAYILGHIPPRDDCLRAWSWAYHKIVSRYANTIRGQFFGHYHSDEEAVFYDEEKPSLPTGVWYIGPSVTPYSGSGENPAYRLYEKDGDHPTTTHAILEHTTYMLDLNKIAAGKTPVWQLEYSAKAAYGMASLNPAEWNKLATRMLTNDTLVQRYITYMGHTSYVRSCDAKCRKSVVCGLKTTRAFDYSHCKGILQTQEDKEHFQNWQAASRKNS